MTSRRNMMWFYISVVNIIISGSAQTETQTLLCNVRQFDSKKTLLVGCP